MTPDDSLFWDYEEEGGENVTDAREFCEKWVCLNDFIFAVIVLVNLGKSIVCVFVVIVIFFLFIFFSIFLLITT